MSAGFVAFSPDVPIAVFCDLRKSHWLKEIATCPASKLVLQFSVLVLGSFMQELAM